MLKGKVIESTRVEGADNSRLVIIFTDGTEFYAQSDNNLDFYSSEKESQRIGWIHPDNLKS